VDALCSGRRQGQFGHRCQGCGCVLRRCFACSCDPKYVSGFEATASCLSSGASPKGSLKNKSWCSCWPAGLLLSNFAPVAHCAFVELGRGLPVFWRGSKIAHAPWAWGARPKSHTPGLRLKNCVIKDPAQARKSKRGKRRVRPDFIPVRRNHDIRSVHLEVSNFLDGGRCPSAAGCDYHGSPSMALVAADRKMTDVGLYLWRRTAIWV